MRRSASLICEAPRISSLFRRDFSRSSVPGGDTTLSTATALRFLSPSWFASATTGEDALRHSRSSGEPIASGGIVKYGDVCLGQSLFSFTRALPLTGFVAGGISTSTKMNDAHSTVNGVVFSTNRMLSHASASSTWNVSSSPTRHSPFSPTPITPSTRRIWMDARNSACVIKNSGSPGVVNTREWVR